jgi:hypothetical protein
VGAGNIGIHSQRQRRYRCTACGKTFSETHGTATYGLKKAEETFTQVVTLLSHGCPVQAIVAAFDLDERTVKDWFERAGGHCRAVHEHVVGGSRLDLGQVQEDEIKVKVQGGSMWMALALMVGSRLWLGGAVSPKRDRALIDALVAQVRAVALCRPTLFAADGLSAYLGAIKDAFRSPLPTGRAGRPRLISWPDIAIVQVVKHRSADRLDIARRIVQGSAAQVTALLYASQGGGQINTAFIERFNATVRQCLGCMARRTRHLARQESTLTHGMFLFGTIYNFCLPHDSLRLPLFLPDGRHVRHRWVHRTPAMTAGLTDHRWTVAELLRFKVKPPPWVPPKRRGRRPASALQAATP